VATINMYKSYSFRTKDPVIDELRTMFQDAGLYDGKGFKTVHERGAATPGTYHKWFKGQTRRPSHPAVMATAHALGYERKWVRKGK
jgi:hypothetical protein